MVHPEPARPAHLFGNRLFQHEWTATSDTSVGVQTDDDVLAAIHAATATLTLVDSPVTAADSVPILHFSGDSVGIQKIVSH